MSQYKNLELNSQVNYASSKLDIQSIVYAVTSECNMNCKYCGAYVPQDKNVLDLDFVLKRFDEIKNLRRLKLSGGEVTLEFDKCLRLCEYCVSRNIILQLNTNAIFLTVDMINQLKKAGLEVVHISLNFADRDNYLEYYGHDYYINLIDNIQLCNEIFDECIIESILSYDTMNNILEVSDLLIDLGVQLHEIQYGVSNEKWVNDINENELKKKIIELASKAKENYKIYYTCFDVDENGKFMELIKNLKSSKYVNFTKCIDGRYQIHMAPNGDLVICDLGYRYLVGNLSTLDFDNIPITGELEYFYKHHNCGKRLKL